MTNLDSQVSLNRSTSRSLSFKVHIDLEPQWNQTIDVVNRFLQQLDSLVSNNNKESVDASISKSHWKPDLSATVCHNTACSKPFSLTERRSHCRRCGEIFCNSCTAYQKKLNSLAQPDPTEKFHKVCAECYNEGPQSMGQSRNWAEVFKHLRNSPHMDGNTSALAVNRVKGKVSVSNFRDSLDFNSELERLKEGYRKSLTTGHVGLLMGMIGVKESNWKNSSFLVLGRMSPKCSECHEDFTLTKSRHHCAVCGVGVCVECSRKDLIVFIEDGSSVDVLTPEAQLAVVRIVGCPEKEPLRCEYLRTCNKCLTQLEDRQVAEYERRRRLEEGSEAEQNNESEAFLLRMITVTDKIRQIKGKIEQGLTTYREWIESFEIGTADLTQGRPKSTIQALSKTQGDLSDLLAEMVTTILSLKKVRPPSSAQMSIARNIILSSCDFYHENMAAYRELRKKVEADIPPAILAAIQQEVDKKAINGCYLTIKQLLYECLALSSRHHLDESFLEQLIPLEQTSGGACYSKSL